MGGHRFPKHKSELIIKNQDRLCGKHGKDFDVEAICESVDQLFIRDGLK